MALILVLVIGGTRCAMGVFYWGTKQIGGAEVRSQGGGGGPHCMHLTSVELNDRTEQVEIYAPVGPGRRCPFNTSCTLGSLDVPR